MILQKVIGIAHSDGLILPREIMRQLGWLRGEHIVIELRREQKEVAIRSLKDEHIRIVNRPDPTR